MEHGVTTIEHATSVYSYLIKDKFREEHDRLTGLGISIKEQTPLLKKLAGMKIDALSPDKLNCLAAMMRDKGAVLCPTLRVYKSILGEIKTQEEKGELSEELRNRKEIIFKLTSTADYIARELSGQGVRLLVGQDNIEPAGTVEEMVLLAKAGVKAEEVLKGATIYAIEWLGLHEKYGSVEAGKIADLVILDADPLENIANTQKVFAVIQHGKVVHQRTD
jgi:hypothetical protein